VIGRAEQDAAFMIDADRLASADRLLGLPDMVPPRGQIILDCRRDRRLQ
jgi:hypothetical protein